MILYSPLAKAATIVASFGFFFALWRLLIAWFASISAEQGELANRTCSSLHAVLVFTLALITVRDIEDPTTAEVRQRTYNHPMLHASLVSR